MNDNMTAADIFGPQFTPFDRDFGTAGMEDDAQDDWCIYCGKLLIVPETRFNSDGTKDCACYVCAIENGWISEGEADDE